MAGEAEVVRNGKTGLMQMGLAKKLEGNPDHPISHGRLCARGQAAIQITYHPDRVRNPLKRNGPRGASPFQEVTWDAALADLKSHLDTLAGGGSEKAVAFLTRPLRGQRQELISRFLSGYGAPPAVEFEFFENDVLRQANLRSFGHEQLPTVDFAQTRYVISFGADFLGVWNSPVSQNVGYGEMRQGDPQARGRFVQVEPRMSQTGANADEWVPIKPGTEGVLALGIAHSIMKQPGYKASGAVARVGTHIEGWSGGLADYAPDQVEKITGVKADRVERLAKEIVQHGPAVALIAGAPLAHTNGMFQALAVNALNAVAGTVGEAGGITFTPQPASTFRPRVSIQKMASDILAAPQSPTQLLLLYEANPVFGTPLAWRVKDALDKIPYIVSFGSFLDETSSLADLILPDNSFLESWVDHVPESGSNMAIHSVAAPVMAPLHQTRAMPDVLLDVSRSLSKPLSPALPQNFEEMLKASFSSLPAPKGKSADESTDVWTTAQKQGGWWGEPSGKEAAAPMASATANTHAAAYAAPQFDGDPNTYPFYFLPYASQQFVDGSMAHLPWLQEMPDVLTSAMWSSWVEINPQTAQKLGIARRPPFPGSALPRYRSRRDCHAGRAGPRQFHALCQRSWHQPDRYSQPGRGTGDGISCMGRYAGKDCES
jgi:anaerobic selenocysteine-containing dehydrogenase